MNVLVAVSDPKLREDVLAVVRAAGYVPSEAGGPEEAISRLPELSVDAVLVDADEERSADAISDLGAAAPGAAVVVIGASPSVDRVVGALRRGARDFLRKPFDVADLERALARATGRPPPPPLDATFRTADPRTLRMLAQLESAAATEATIRLVGESGTGKDALARLVHLHSPRRGGPFVVVACAGLPRSLAETELFGHVRDAFSDAGRARTGRLAAAHGGTLVLDEVADLAPALQPKLLRVLQEREIVPVGGRAPRHVDLRVVATTRRDLAAEVAAERFREDLYYRLDVVTLAVPPLRERPDDIPLLAGELLERFARSFGEEPAELGPEAVRALQARPFRGNVRELENLMRRAALLFPGRPVEVERLDAPLARGGDGLPSGLRALNLRDLERAAIARSLQVAGGNRTLASRALGISVRTLRNKIRLYELA